MRIALSVLKREWTCQRLVRLSSQVQHFFQKIIGRQKTKTFTRTIVDQRNNSVQLFLRHLIEISSSWEEKNELIHLCSHYYHVAKAQASRRDCKITEESKTIPQPPSVTAPAPRVP